jgi:16S rRNA (uracil1498-N3)-methyltransferase
MNELPRKSFSEALEPRKDALLLIGPEGDFTEEEVNLASVQGAVGVTLGNTRLRTETAAMAACAFFHLMNS